MRGGVPLAPGKEEKRDGKELEEREAFLFRLNSSKQGGGEASTLRKSGVGGQRKGEFWCGAFVG